MALELHIMTTGSTRGVPVRDLGIIGAAVAEAWPGSTMGNCEGHEHCAAVFRQAEPRLSEGAADRAIGPRP